MTTDEMIAVMEAYSEGKKIEMKYKLDNDDTWINTDNPGWNWAVRNYRVKQEPREFSVVLNRFGMPVGIAHDSSNIITVGNKTALMDSTIIKVREVL